VERARKHGWMRGRREELSGLMLYLLGADGNVGKT
jgi:hypothetical protein